MKTISVVIPIHKIHEDPAREAALRHVLRRLGESMKQAEIVIVEQVAQGVKACKYATQTVEDYGEFCKARLMNAGAACASGEILLLLDSDVILNWRRVRETSEKLKPGTVCKPFSTILRLDEEQTKQAYATGRPAISRTQPTTNKFGGGAVMLYKSDFEAVQYCEDFTGWGFQDIDFGRRLEEIYKVVEIKAKGYHLWHDRDPDALLKSESCARNRALYLSRKKSASSLEDTALVFAYYGDSELRRNAVRRGLEKILSLDPLPHIYFAELGSEHFKEFESAQNFHWVGIPCGDEQRDLMQKEALYNKIANEHCKGYRFLIFGDPDCWTADRKWTAKTRAELLRLGPDAGVQPFSEVVDDRSGRVRPSYSSRRVRGDKNCSFSPGGYWAFHADFFFNKMKGFNPLCICGSGDAMFVIEHVEDHRYPTFSTTDLPVYAAVLRKNQPKIKLGTVPVRFEHCYHGEWKYNPKTGAHGRGYRGRWHIIGAFGENAVTENVSIDENGLLAWKDLNCPLRRALARKGECESEEDAMRVVAEAKRGLHLIRESDHNAVLEDHYYKDHGRFENNYIDIMDHLRGLPEAIREKPVLEVGSYKLPLDKNSYRMDIDETGVDRLTLHDARIVPYPFGPKQFSVVVASHVLEHIDDKQSAAIEEFSRIADYAVIALPYMWERGSAHHLGIDEHTVREWLRGWPVRATFIGGKPTHRQIIMVIDFTEGKK